MSKTVHCAVYNPYLTVDSDAVVEVTPLIRTEADLQSVGQAWDESELHRRRKRQFVNHQISPQTQVSSL